MTVSVVTVIRADEPLAGETAGNDWLDRLGEQEFTDELLDDTLFTLDRVRAADAAASGVPFGTPTAIGQILAARVGYGDGDQVASGRFIEAFDIDAPAEEGVKGWAGPGRQPEPQRSSGAGNAPPPVSCSYPGSDST